MTSSRNGKQFCEAGMEVGSGEVWETGKNQAIEAPCDMPKSLDFILDMMGSSNTFFYGGAVVRSVCALEL